MARSIKEVHTINYYPINEGAARRAKEMNSFSDYKEGSATAEYRAMVDKAAAIAEKQKSRVDPMYHEKIDHLLDTYARKLAENMNQGFAIDARVPSVLIAGPSNFPVGKKEKQNRARDSNMEEWRHIQGLLDKIRSTGMGGISADDPAAIEKLQKKLDGLERSQLIIARAIRENNARLVIIDPVQAFLGADVDMNRANEVRPIFRSLGDIAQATGCAIVLIGHLNKAAGTQSTYRGLGSIDITAAVRSLLFIGKLKDSPTTRVLIHEKSSLAPPGQSLAFSLGDEKGFEWIGAYDITADELLAGTDTAKTESKTAQAQMLILELLANGKRMPSAELEKAVKERGISSRTMRTAKSRIGDRLVTEKDGTAWVCYLRD